MTSGRRRVQFEVKCTVFDVIAREFYIVEKYVQTIHSSGAEQQAANYSNFVDNKKNTRLKSFGSSCSWDVSVDLFQKLRRDLRI